MKWYEIIQQLTIDQESFFTDTLQIKENMSLLLKRDYSSNKYRWQFLRSILRSIISFFIDALKISSTSALTFKRAFSYCAVIAGLWKAVLSVTAFECIFHTCKDVKASEIMRHSSAVRGNRTFLDCGGDSAGKLAGGNFMSVIKIRVPDQLFSNTWGNRRLNLSLNLKKDFSKHIVISGYKIWFFFIIIISQPCCNSQGHCDSLQNPVRWTEKPKTTSRTLCFKLSC